MIEYLRDKTILVFVMMKDHGAGDLHFAKFEL